MTQRQLADAYRKLVADILGTRVTIEQGRELLTEFGDLLVYGLRRDGKVTIDAIGTISEKWVNPKSGVSKMSGEEKEWSVPGHNELKINPSNWVLSALNTFPDGEKDDNGNVIPSDQYDTHQFLEKRGIEKFDIDGFDKSFDDFLNGNANEAEPEAEDAEYEPEAEDEDNVDTDEAQ